MQRARLWNVAWQQIVKGGNVGGALNAGVAAHRYNAAARTADVAEQKLQKSSCPDHLHARRVLRATNGFNVRAGPFTTGIFEERFIHQYVIFRPVTYN